MGCVNAKANGPGASPEQMPRILDAPKSPVHGHGIGKSIVAVATAAEHEALRAASAVGSGAHHVGSGVASAASHVGHGAVDALTAVGHEAQHVGAGAAGVVCQAGHVAADKLTAMEHRVHGAGKEAVGAISQVSHAVLDVDLTGKSPESLVTPTVEKTWYEQVYDYVVSMGPASCCCQTMAGSNLLGALVKKAFEEFDTSVLGVDVEIGALHIEPATGRVEIEGFKVFNPEGFYSEYLLHAHNVVVDIDIQKLLLSSGKELHVEELVFDGIDVIYEQGLHGSNLHHILKKLESQQAKATEPEQAADQAEKAKASEVKVVLHAILAQNIGAKLATKLTRGHGLRLEVATLSYNDFDEEMGVGRGLMDIIHVLLSTLIKSVLATVVGKHGTEAMVEAAHGITDKLKAVGSGLNKKLHSGE